MAEISAKVVKALRDSTGAGMMDCKTALKDADGNVDKALALLRERGIAKAGKRSGRETSEGAVAIALSGVRAGIVELGCETDFVAKTDDFQALASDIAGAVAATPTIASAEAALAADMNGATVAERIQQAVAKVGENIELKRAGGVDVGNGKTGGYVHMGGKLGVIVGLESGASGDGLEALAKDIAMHVAAVDPTPIAIGRDGVPSETLDNEKRVLTNQALQSGKPENVVEKIVTGRLNKFYAEYCLLEQAFVKDPDTTVGELVKKVGGEIGGEVSVASFVRFKLGEASA